MKNNKKKSPKPAKIFVSIKKFSCETGISYRSIVAIYKAGTIRRGSWSPWTSLQIFASELEFWKNETNLKNLKRIETNLKNLKCHEGQK